MIGPLDFMLGLVGAAVPPAAALAAGHPDLATPVGIASGVTAAAAQRIYSMVHAMLAAPTRRLQARHLRPDRWRKGTVTAVTHNDCEPKAAAQRGYAPLGGRSPALDQLEPHSAKMLSVAADTAGMCLVPRPATSGQRRYYKLAPGGELGQIGSGWASAVGDTRR
jgi:hypothetical protein